MKVAIIRDVRQDSSVDEWEEEGMGALYVAKAARMAGYDVSLINQFPEADSLANYDVIGFSVNTQDVPDVLRIAEAVKKLRPDTTIVTGGPHISGEIHEHYNWQGIELDKWLPILHSTYIDYLIAREGDAAFPELLKSIERGSKTNRIIYAQRVEDLNKIPYPTEFRNPRTFIQTIEGDRRIVVPIIESRGCPGQQGKTCKFCSSGASWGKSIAYRSGENVLGEIEDVVRTHELDPNEIMIFFEGLELMLHQRKFYELLEVFEGTPYKLGSCGDIRLANTENLERMKRAGYVDVLWGLESLDQRILDEYKTGLRLEEIERGLKLASEVGIRNTGMFMIGFPNETKASLELWFERVPELVDDARFSIVTPFPGTDFRRELIWKGYTIDSYSAANYDTAHLVYRHLHFEEGELEEIHSDIVEY